MRPLAWMFVFAGAFALLAGSVLRFGGQAVFDADTFATRATRSLEDPDVADWVGRHVTDEVLRRNRDLTPYRPLVLAVTTGVVRAEATRVVLHRALRQAHMLVVSGGEQPLLVSLPDVGLLLRSALAARPDLAERIPTDATASLAGIEQLPAVRFGLAVLRARAQIRAIGLALMLAGVLLLSGALALAPRRRIALYHTGMTLAVLSLSGLGFLALGGTVIAWYTPDRELGRALAGIWWAFTGPAQARALVLTCVGLALSAAAGGLVERLRVTHRLGRAWRSLFDPGAPRGPKLLTASLAVLLGGFGVLAPALAVRLYAMLGGALLLLLGMEELFRTLLVPRGGEGARWMPSEAEAIGTLRLAAAAFVFTIVLLLAGLVLRAIDHRERAPAVGDAVNGHPELADRRLDRVVFAGTHNAMGAADARDWMFPSQERGLRAQLDDGVRAFLLDVHAGWPAGDRVKTDLESEPAARAMYEQAIGREGVEAAMRIRNRIVGEDRRRRGLYLCHGFCELGATPLDAALREMRDWLVEHPSEVLILVFEDPGVTAEEVARVFERTRLVDFVYLGPARPPWPTLREMVAANQRVLVLSEHARPGVPWYHAAFEVLQETAFSFADTSRFSVAPNRGGTRGSLRLLNHWVDTTPRALPSNAAVVNDSAFLMRRARQFVAERGGVPNIIAVDFYRTGDLFEVVDALNGVSR